MKKNPNTSFVAEENDKIIGVILAGNDGRRDYIYHACVMEYFRKQKIGTKLVTQCLNALKNEGINKVALLVFSKNEDGDAFWEHQGFIKREDISYRNNELT